METHSRWHRGLKDFIARPITGKRPRSPSSKIIKTEYYDRNGKRVSAADKDKHDTYKEYHATKGWRTYKA